MHSPIHGNDAVKKKNGDNIMIKNIVKGKQIFSKKATPATEADRQVITIS